MPSAKILAQKQADLGALVEKIKGAQSGVLVDYTGITVEQDTKLLSLIHIEMCIRDRS